MLRDPLTLSKLIVLYVLNRVAFPMTAAQISDFVLEREYAASLTLQQAICELNDAGLITSETVRNRTHLSITDEGRETLHYFKNRINYAIRWDIDTYIRENEFTLRNEISVQGVYYKSATGDYDAHLTAMDGDMRLVEITISVPTEKIASVVCDNWQKKNQEIYKYLTGQLF